MEMPEIITAILAVLLVAALIVTIWLYIAVKLFKRKRDIQEKAHTNRLLNDIIEWAVAIAKIGSAGGLPFVTEADDKRPKRLPRMNWALEYQTVNAKAKYIMVIAATMNGQRPLQSLLNKVNSKLEEFTKLLWEFVACSEDYAEERKLKNKINNSEQELQEYVSHLIDEANAIKHREIK